MAISHCVQFTNLKPINKQATQFQYGQIPHGIVHNVIIGGNDKVLKYGILLILYQGDTIVVEAAFVKHMGG